MPTYVAVLALVLAYLALVTAYLALRTLARLRRATSVLARGGDGHETILEATERHVELAEQLSDEVAVLRGQLTELAKRPAATVSARPDNSELVNEVRGDVSALGGSLTALQGELAAIRADAERGLRNVALVRYDAFDGMAGRMSFSLALLDDAGDGVALSALTGRSDTRVYAKGVTGGRGEHELSPEEQQAVSAALVHRQRDGLAARLARRRAS